MRIAADERVELLGPTVLGEGVLGLAREARLQAEAVVVVGLGPLLGRRRSLGCRREKDE